eukprot:GHRR01016887.1.p1 GENE.GHRR01016887.1~~GHRR01016887.1.p1  ORF type:complete len:200 (+),score=35.71 GHRR01016887.1:1694-2293(+)
MNALPCSALTQCLLLPPWHVSRLYSRLVCCDTRTSCCLQMLALDLRWPTGEQTQTSIEARHCFCRLLDTPAQAFMRMPSCARQTAPQLVSGGVDSCYMHFWYHTGSCLAIMHPFMLWSRISVGKTGSLFGVANHAELAVGVACFDGCRQLTAEEQLHDALEAGEAMAAVSGAARAFTRLHIRNSTLAFTAHQHQQCLVA